jgi:hypothetical protein
MLASPRTQFTTPVEADEVVNTADGGDAAEDEALPLLNDCSFSSAVLKHMPAYMTDGRTAE